MIKKTFLLLSLLVLFFLILGMVSANDLNSTDNDDILAGDVSVDGDSFGDIQSAVDNAGNGDKIYLNGKTYDGTGSQIDISKSLTIDGASPNEEKISTLNANHLSRIIYINSNCNVVLKNIVFEKADYNGNGIVIYSLGNLTLNSCTIKNINGSYTSNIHGSVYMASKTNFTLDNVSFEDNIIETTGSIDGGFLYFPSNCYMNVSNIYFKNNKITSTKNGLYGGGIYLDPKCKSYIYNYNSTNNIFTAYYRLYGGNICTDSDLICENIFISNNTGKSYENFSSGNDIDSVGIISFGKNSVVNNYIFVNNIVNLSNPIKNPGGMALFINERNALFNLSNFTIKNNYIYHNYSLPSDPLVASIYPIQAIVRASGCGTFYKLDFIDNYADEGICGLQLSPSTAGVSIVSDCSFYNNFVGSSSLDSDRIYFADHGGAICVSGAYKGSAIIKNCIFVNNTNSQGGAITPHNNCIVENCQFINNTATKFYGGAISTENGLDMNNANITIRNCYFEGNAAPIGGAIQAKGDWVTIEDCNFVDNDAVQGGGVFLEGKNLKITNCNFTDNNATHDLTSRGILTGQDYLPEVFDWTALGGAVYIHGENAKLENNRFLYNSAIHSKDGTFEGQGGAVYIYGNNSKIISGYFDDNFAHSGNGSAVYIYGVNASVNNSEFYNHDSSRGTVFILGSNSTISDSKFMNNTASRGGAGLYCEGNYTLVENTLFENNNATIHGGAIHSHGDYIRISNCKFVSNNALPDAGDIDYGLGGAIYTRGDFNDILYSTFEFNTARNGSAIYNRGKNLTIEDNRFHYNQAWSYLLNITVTPESSVYSKTNKVVVNITHIGGDNIINAIYNDGSYKNIFFYNVTYEHSSTDDGLRNSGLTKINPVLGAENSQNGELIYQDSREDLQIVDFIFARDKQSGGLLMAVNDINGDIVYNTSGRTGLYGNFSTSVVGLKPGNYTVYVSHPEDRLYKAIENNARFEILPYVDLSISKSSDKDSYFVGDVAVFTITVESLGTDASNVIVNESLPEGLEIVSFEVSKGSFNDSSMIWTVGDLAQETNATLTLKVKILTNGTFTNTVNVTCDGEDVNLTNNVANSTITAEENNSTDENSTNTTDSIDPIIYETVSGKASSIYEDATPENTVSAKDNETGNPLMMLFLALILIPLRRFRK